MFKLLTNYVREQKNSLLQVFGLGFLIIIMVSSFLSLSFATNYVKDQYWHDIAKEEFHQDVTFNLNANFVVEDMKDSWLDNINYKIEANDPEINTKMLNATFQIRKLPEYNESEKLYFYRFYFANDDQNQHINVGKNLAKVTGYNYVDFKLSIPFNYPSIEIHDDYLKGLADTINEYVFDPNNNATEANETNFFITNSLALNHYNDKIQPNFPWATRNYEIDDIKKQAKLYQLLIMGMLYGDNLTWRRAYNITDLIMYGKTFSFIQITPKDRLGVPVLVSSNENNFNPLLLKDNEILIYREFAKKNNLTVGQDYIFSGYNFHIAGFATNAFSANNNYYFNMVSDNKNQTVAFVNQATLDKIATNPYAKGFYNQINGFNPEISSKNISKKIDNYWLYKYFNQKLINDKNINKSKLYRINNGIHTKLLFNPLNISSSFSILENWTWATLNKISDTFIQIASVFLVLIFVVVAVIVFIIIFKMIDRNKQLIGILKAHGYPSWKLNLALVSSTIFPVILFAIVGSCLAIIFTHFMVFTFSSTMILISYGWPFYFQSALLVILIPALILFIISMGIVALLLRVNVLTLINNNWAKNKYNFKINSIFSYLSLKLTKKFSYQNKLAMTTNFRGFGKVIFVILVSIFASTLLLFSFSSGGLINNMLGLQFAAINYKFDSEYQFQDNQIFNNFTENNELLYKKVSVDMIKIKPSLYEPILQAINNIRENPEQPEIIDFRYGYIMGSELLKIKNFIEPILNEFPFEFQDFWEQNIYYIDYLTNNNGTSQTDLMVNFGILPYDSNIESPYSKFELNDAHDFNINTIDTDEYYYDNELDVLTGDWSLFNGTRRTVQGITDKTSKFLKPGLKNSNFNNFANLTLANMENSGGWLNNNFLTIRQSIIDKFKIENPETSSVKIIPMIGSTTPGVNGVPGGDGNNIGKTVLYNYKGLDQKQKYIIGIIYDGGSNLLQSNVLMPNQWITKAIFGLDADNLSINFANGKFTNFDDNELLHYLSIISKNNDYSIDLTKLSEINYLNEKGIVPGLKNLYDVEAIKDIMKASQYSFQLLILLFSIFSVLLSFMIIIIISNINIRDNLILINILRSLGYSVTEVSYIFLVIMIPLLIIFSLLAIFIAPILTGYVAAALSSFVSQQFPIIFRWWYYALTLLIIILIYFVSYCITWKLNINNRQLMNLTK